MRIVALDLGTKTGWATGQSTDQSRSMDLWGTEDFGAKRRNESFGMRYIRFKAWLKEILGSGEGTMVVYEEVKRHAGTQAAHVYGGLMTHLAAYCDENGIEYTSIPVGTIKKHATGKGNSDKDKMIGAAKERWPSFEGDDNAADALHMLDYTRKHELN